MGCMRELLRALQPRAVLGVRLAEALMRAEDVMFAHVLGVAARRRLAAERLGHGADVVRAGAAADAEIAHPELVGLLGERGDLPAVAGEGIEAGGKRLLARQAVAMRVGERLEVR